jgi:Zn-dependent peptidase ImmA (M78 family)
MLFLNSIFSELGWGERALEEEDVLRILRREKIKLAEYPISGSLGFYMASAGRHFITVDSRLRGVQRLHVILHELAHYYLHVPAHATAAHFFRLRPDTKQEFEAEAFALVALLPEPKLRRLLATPEEEWEPGFTAEMVEVRLKVLQLYGV